MSAKETESFFKSLTFRGFLVALLMLLLLIPLFMIGSIVNERKQYYHAVVDDIASGWGMDQTVIGPVLAVPYTERISSVETVTDSSGASKAISRDVFNNKTMMILPEMLNINAKLNEKHRKRGIYTSLVYQADVQLSGHFNLDVLPKASNKYSIQWDKAWLAVGLSDTKAVNSTSPLRWQDTSAKFEPGTRMQKILKNGFHASMANLSTSKSEQEFKIELSFKGNSRFSFAPLGESTTTKIESTWPNPSFKGGVLPVSKVISAEGFNATWRISHLARNYPQSWLKSNGNEQLENYKLDSLTAGVELFTPVSLYSKMDRAVKYGVLFIGLTFLTFLIFEVSVKSKMHILQYVIVGLSLSLFYLLLISLSEHLALLNAYIYAAGTIIGIITLYTFAILRSFAKGLFILILLSSLYGALYFILQMEDYALLAGAGAMLFVIVILMLASWNLKYDD